LLVQRIARLSTRPASIIRPYHPQRAAVHLDLPHHRPLILLPLPTTRTAPSPALVPPIILRNPSCDTPEFRLPGQLVRFLLSASPVSPHVTPHSLPGGPRRSGATQLHEDNHTHALRNHNARTRDGTSAPPFHRRVADKNATLAAIGNHHGEAAPKTTNADGLVL